MSAIEAGTTADGSEIIGLRTGYNGITYPTAGDMVRAINQELLDYVVSKSFQDSSGNTILDSNGEPILGRVKYVSYDSYLNLQNQMNSLMTVLRTELDVMYKQITYIMKHALLDSYE
jgi:hypothetical protein